MTKVMLIGTTFATERKPTRLKGFCEWPIGSLPCELRWLPDDRHGELIVGMSTFRY
ncbi:hypothetical protein [Paenibacillus sp. YIM B09110]|uniref:hypothetical protein n=1 Tax=Paenibacillus sp. YIM B09110 TaxID=3126102 RepID=UPI00301DFC5E